MVAKGELCPQTVAMSASAQHRDEIRFRDRHGYARDMARHVDKPWGHETIWTETPFYTGKKIHVDAGRRLSLQYHETKRESVFVLSGTLRLHLGQGDDARVVILEAGDSADIPALEVHRFEAPAEGDVDIIEVATPEVDDVIRIEDDYSREGTSAP
jgi:mannose-6-phosphate isomerase